MAKDTVDINGEEVSFKEFVVAQLQKLTENSVSSPDGLIPSYVTVTDEGLIEGFVYAIAFANVGTTDVLVLGQTLKPGRGINYDGGKYAEDAFTYDATGGELLITYAK